MNSERLLAENIFVSIKNREILKGVSISASKGNITALLGRNGAGKSTMLRSVFGTQACDDSTIFIDGKLTRQAYSMQGAINFAPQHNFLPGNMKVKKILALFQVKNDDLFATFPELEVDRDKKLEELSGGTVRLWTMLTMIYAKTSYTLLDEPFTHIMPMHVEKLKEVLVKEKKNKGFIISDHLYTHLLDISDQVYFMKEGSSFLLKDKSELVLHGYIKQLDDSK